MTGSPWLTVAQACERAQLSRKTVMNALHDGQLIGHQLTTPGGRWRIHIDALDAWLGQKPTPRRRFHVA